MRRPEEVFVFVRRGGEYLVLHRSPRQGSYWHGVAGGLEEGESYGEAAARELREETGLAAEPLDIDAPYASPAHEEAWRRPVPEGVESIAVRAFVAEAPHGWEPELDWEHDGYQWCSPEQALALLYWPEPREVLQALAERG